MNDIEYLQFLLKGMGVDRADTAYTATLSKQLEFTKARTYDIKYPELRAKQLIPVSHEIPVGAKTWKYEQWDAFGMANIIANYADDLPFVDVIKDEIINKIHAIGDAYQYSIEDLQRDAFAGNSIVNRRASAARRAVENRFEEFGATGRLSAGIAGVLNHPNISLVTPATGTWSTATALQMLEDLNTLVNTVINNNSETFFPDTVVLSGPLYRTIASEPMLDNTGRTVLSTFLDTSPYINTVESWVQCATADAAGTGPRILCYKRDPEVLTYEIPQEFQQLAPQPVNLAFKIPCHARVAGVAVPYPLAAGYMDGC